jgi:hypothetical protein
MRVKLIYVIIFVLSVFISCQKQKLKQPVETQVKFSIVKNESSSNLVKIKNGILIINNFIFKGQRVKGIPFDFKRSFDNGLTIDFTNKSIEKLKFDIPQGDYTNLDFTLNTPDKIKGLQIFGDYKLSQGPNVEVILEIEQQLVFNLKTLIKDFIEFKKGNPKTITLNFNADYWFETLTENDLDNATLTTNNNGVGLGNSTIFISSTQNTNLYQIILSRILLHNNAMVN